MATCEVRGISVTVDGKAVVRDASLSLASGTITLLVGTNGSGKSSLVNALMGHPGYTITQGQLLLDDEDITALAPHEKARKGLFLSFQHVPKVGGVTLATFLHKAYEAVHCREVPALEFYLNQKKRADELGLNSALLDRPVTEGLSGGERKQSELLQLLALEPRFAFLDEIDSGVDPAALKTVFEVVSLLASRGTGFLIISHHPHTSQALSYARAYTMRDGVIA